jgi:CDGSH-type Zn-finger protein
METKSAIKNITIESVENGPFLVKVDGKVTVALCRCGHSNNKPYCDGSHTKIGFKAEKKEINIV